MLVMKNLQITKRDVKVFFLGVLVMLIIVIIYDWKEAVEGFRAGYNDLRNESLK
jgi:hypothetical protein